MLNRINKCFLISLIVMLISLTIIFLLTMEISNIKVNNFFEESSYVISTIVFFVLPSCIITQIVTLIIKIFSKNKNKNEWITVFINFVSILLFGLISILLIAPFINPLI